MPWEIRITSDKNNAALGSRKSVAAHLSATLPGAVLCLPPPPPDEFYQWFSPEMAAQMKENRNLEALFEADDFTIEFYCANQEEIQCLHADVRGNGNPLPVLARLCLPKEWIVVNSADSSRVDLSANGAAQWDAFRTWRDQAIEEIEEEE